MPTWPRSDGLHPRGTVLLGWLVDQEGARWPTAISVGLHPTFEGVTRQVEAHVHPLPRGSRGGL
ncbi:hypothetical protein QJS66_06680 [Kocuria rhizophila]|nr:hypothetical protein QJS66_06680 [Kocuria rhizophila]